MLKFEICFLLLDPIQKSDPVLERLKFEIDVTAQQQRRAATAASNICSNNNNSIVTAEHREENKHGERLCKSTL